MPETDYLEGTDSFSSASFYGEKYKYLLLLATMCKYIQQIEKMYDNDIPEEIQYSSKNALT